MCTLRQACLLAGLFTCIQSILHLMAISYGLALNLCSTKSTSRFTNMLYYTYFCSEHCRNNVTLILTNGPTEVDLSCNGSARMGTYLFFYTVLDAMWLVSSVALFVGVLIKVRSVMSGFFYFQWVLMTLVMLCVDLMASIQYAGDFRKIKGAKEWLKFVGLRNKTMDYRLGLQNGSYGEGFKFGKDLDENMVQIPALLITLVSTRFGLGYLSNVVFFSLVLVQAVDLFRETYLHPCILVRSLTKKILVADIEYYIL